MKLSATFLSHSIVAAILTLPLVTQAQQSGLTPIITFDQEHQLINMANLLPMVQVFSTGEVVVYRGPNMTNPGRYVLQLNDEELATLVTLAETAGLPQLDVSAELVGGANDRVLRVVSDATTSTFEFNRISGQNVLSSGDGTTSDATQTVVIDDVLFTASLAPESITLDALGKLHIQLVQIFSRAGS